MEQKIWFITGISSGLGKALATAVIEKGDFVIGTFRKKEQVEAFNSQYDNKAEAVQLDITDAAAIQKTYQYIHSKYRKLDVLVNNAGVGFAGAIEETSDAETRQIFEANFFGVLNTTKAFLPLFRQQKSGHIIQISSHGGIKAFPGFGIYNASKFALEGFSEALAQEIAPLGIQLTMVEPGPFRTEFAGNGFGLAAQKIDDYDQTAGAFRQKIKAVHGQQEGDPVKAAQAIIQISEVENPPLRLPLGKVPYVTIGMKLKSVEKDLADWKEVAEGVVF